MQVITQEVPKIEDAAVATRWEQETANKAIRRGYLPKVLPSEDTSHLSRKNQNRSKY